MSQASARTPLSPLIVACLAATWFIWGSTYLVIRFAIQAAPPFFVMGSRFVAAGLLLYGYARWRGAALPSMRQWAHALVIGALMLGLGMGCTAYAEESIASGLTVAFVAVSPLAMILLRLPFGHRPARRELLGLAVGIAGVLLLTQGGGFSASPRGLALLTLASAGWTVGSVLSQQGLPLAPGPMGFASEMLAGGVLLLLASLGAGEAWPTHITWPMLALWGYLVVFGSLLAFNAYMVLLARAPTGLALSYTYVNPVIALGLGVSLGGEHITTGEWGAAVIVLLGVVILVTGRR